MKAAWVIFVCLIQITFGAVTEEQMAQAQSLIRQSCVGKSKITMEIADVVRAGNAPDEKPVKCFIHCVFEMTNAMKKAKLTIEGFFKQVDTLMPEEMRPTVKKLFGECKEEFPTGIKDPCEAGYALYKCIREKSGDQFTFA